MWDFLAIMLMLLAVFLIPLGTHHNIALFIYISKLAYVIGLALVIWCLVKIIRQVYHYYKTRDRDDDI